ncbi:bifunctional 5,10-methylene-tetrahydrofolate dehydrogenase/5,10-methylene-tetrahydrofolate cyclohydrolase [Halosquirtibacter laminarini]|uniref:Bifunctional 5,10-methylene-tetrahydrofolate dehydrogenase/5,10-methylene-tetrahydrofolate cyclohydrolase n=1 Tax=Halosquirtibacter laminarini TaxID=3374600 RepID=A0AC61NLR1_9BACT|nr:bifunctional 5,10-methylene-tetrahydrofolate dehydrogenase/5,10-methylene-tetrahydrofolate cyclohydrolase [Prolixibacteraceae bacterium]
MIRLDGKQTSVALKNEIAEEVAKRKEQGLKQPHLAAILVGNNGASETYVANKVKACKEVGFKSSLIRYETSVSEEELLSRIDKINQDQDIDGLIVQLPLPDHISEEKVTERINPNKDVDGFHPQNMGRLALGSPCYVSATPHGIMELISRYNIETSGKKCVVIGRSNIVGRPMSILMSQKGIDATVTLCHSRTVGLKEICLEADIIIAALGKAEFLKADMVKEGATIIDVGITRVPSDKTKSGWKLLGDVDFENVAPKCSFITPVPGGVGPMTIASLLYNTLMSAKNEIYK